MLYPAIRVITVLITAISLEVQSVRFGKNRCTNSTLQYRNSIEKLCQKNYYVIFRIWDVLQLLLFFFIDNVNSFMCSITTITSCSPRVAKSPRGRWKKFGWRWDRQINFICSIKYENELAVGLFKYKRAKKITDQRIHVEWSEKRAQVK